MKTILGRKSGGLSRKLVIGFALLTVLVILTEGILRFGLGLGNPILVVSDSACGYIVKPDQNVYRFFARTHINHFGMRSDEVSAAHTPGTMRLLFIGDSITYGTSRVGQTKLFTELLHRDLPLLIHRPVEVLNASASAWAPANEVSYVTSRGVFQSDVVFEVLNDGDVAQPPATLSDVGDDLPQHRPLTAIGELYSRYLKPKLFHARQHNDAGDVVKLDEQQVTRKNLDALDRMNAIVGGAGARFVIVYLPFRRDIPEPSSSARTILKEWTADRHIPMIDISPVESQYSPNEITIDNGWHLNAKGHEIVAQAIEQAWFGALAR